METVDPKRIILDCMYVSMAQRFDFVVAKDVNPLNALADIFPQSVNEKRLRS